MNWPDGANVALAKTLVDYLADPASPLRHIAAKHNSLPVFNGIGGISLLASDGVVIQLDDFEVPTSWSDEKWTRFIHILAGKRFPALAIILPRKPENARACTECSGTGQIENLHGAHCGTCLGLGWIDSLS
ncbi:MAG: hypothetical protein SF172_12705 [Burkholderiales bacterium]|nr:hypothetical protein [Burkholderiales bacterium]